MQWNYREKPCIVLLVVSFAVRIYPYNFVIDQIERAFRVGIVPAVFIELKGARYIHFPANTTKTYLFLYKIGTLASRHPFLCHKNTFLSPPIYYCKDELLKRD